MSYVYTSMSGPLQPGEPIIPWGRLIAYAGDGSVLGDISVTGDSHIAFTAPTASIMRVVFTTANSMQVGSLGAYLLVDHLPSLDLSCPGSVGRTAEATCSVGLSDPSFSLLITGWQFKSDSNWTVVRTDEPGATTWSGPMIHSGEVTVSGTIAGVPRTASARIDVAPRNWAGQMPPYPQALPDWEVRPNDFEELPVIDLPNGSQQWPKGRLALYEWGINYQGHVGVVGSGPNTDVFYLVDTPGWITPVVLASPYLENDHWFYLAQNGKRPGDPNPPKKYFKDGWCTMSHMNALRLQVQWHEGSVLGPRKSHHQELVKYTQANDAAVAVEGIGFYVPPEGNFLPVATAAFSRAYLDQASLATDLIVHASSNLDPVTCKAHLQ